MPPKVLKLKKGNPQVGAVGKDYFWSPHEKAVFQTELARKEAIQNLLNQNHKPKGKVDYFDREIIETRIEGKKDRESLEREKKEISEKRQRSKVRRTSPLKKFRIFEGGPGNGFTKTLETIIEAEARAPNREFVIADEIFSEKGKKVTIHNPDNCDKPVRKYVTARWEEEISKTGGQKLRNLTAIAGNATEALAKYPPKHFDIVFSSYLINNMPLEERERYLNTAFEKLRTGGRLIQINSYNIIEQLREFALRRGMGFHIIPLSDKLAEKSTTYVQRRHTDWGRRLQLEEYPPNEIKRLMEKYGLKSEDEIERPVVIILRKRKPLLLPPKQKIQTPTQKPITKPPLLNRVLNWLKI